MAQASSRILAIIAIPASILALPAGCAEAPGPAPQYRAVSGFIAGCTAGSRQVSIQIAEPSGSNRVGRTLFCAFQADSELYVNDRFAALDSIRVGDAIDMVGYFERANRAVEKAPPGQPILVGDISNAGEIEFVILSASVTQPSPEPPPPVGESREGERPRAAKEPL